LGENKNLSCCFGEAKAGGAARWRYFCSPRLVRWNVLPNWRHGDTLQARLDKLDAVLARTDTTIQDAALFAQMAFAGHVSRRKLLSELRMTARKRIGMLTPSSNTVVEPMTAAMLAGVPDVSAHFSRFKVTEIAVSQSSDRQFGADEILRAAELLTHAKVDVIAWNGTSASWLGFERDEQLCQRITAATAVAACTSVLAFREIFERTGVSRVGLVTPYSDAVQVRIVENWRRAGIICLAERHSGLQDNFAFAEIAEREIAAMTRAVAGAGIEAVAIVCTNMRGGVLVESLEAELGVPVYDSVATTLWKSLILAEIPPASIRGWGRLFSNPLLASGQSVQPEKFAAPT
jgi:maleate isomerase